MEFVTCSRGDIVNSTTTYPVSRIGYTDCDDQWEYGFFFAFVCNFLLTFYCNILGI